jgi:RNA polymerase-binding protein DksA
MPIDTDNIREILLASKADLQARINRIHDHARDPLNADSAEQAAELGNVQVVAALESEAIQELADIDAALRRLTAGTYGICASCGEEINEQRLEARPACTECLDCAELQG